MRGRPTQADYAAAIHAALAAAKRGDQVKARTMMFAARIIAKHI
jgi:hypothetical protein